MDAALNGKAVLDAVIDETDQGPWTARVEVDSEDEATGSVTLTAGQQSFVGTVAAARVEAGRWIAELVGGANGLATELPAKNYQGATAGDVISDVMTECGETYDSAGSDQSIASHTLPYWTRAKGEARLALAAIANELGAFWRVGRNGRVQMLKDDAWPSISGAYVEESRDPSRNQVVIAPADESVGPEARPGVTVGGERVVTVRTLVRPTGLRQALQIHDGTELPQDSAFAIAELARRANATQHIYERWYPATVIAQESDGSLQVMPDSDVVSGFGLTKVPLLTGIPGMTVKVAPKTRVRLFFENGRPSAPACALWDQSAQGLLEVQLQSTVKCVVVAPQMVLGPNANVPDPMVLGNMLMAYFDGVIAAISNAWPLITPGPATGGGAPAKAAFDIAIQALAAAKQAALSQTTKVG